MGKWGKFDFREFEQLKKQIEHLDKNLDGFMRDFLLEMALRAERKIKKRTPVGQGRYRVIRDDGGARARFKSGKRKGQFKRELVHQGGQLRRNWKVGQVIRQGDNYIVEIINETEYASFVEYGHRTGKDRRRWVEGRFMMTISMQEIEGELPSYLERRLVKWLKGGGLG